MKIRWITKGREHAHLTNGQVVVRLRHDFDDARNIVTATMLYLNKGLLRVSRPYLDGTLVQALDLTIAWKMLDRREQSDSRNYFLENIFTPSVEKDSAVQNNCEKMDLLDARGVMTRILLRELRNVGTKASALREKPTPKLKVETQGFCDFLHTIESSAPGEFPALDFVGERIRTAVLLVASWQTLAAYGLRHHKRRFREKQRSGIETIYVVGSGRENVNRARHLAQWAQSQGLAEIVRSQSFVAPSRMGRAEASRIVIICHSAHTRADTLLDPEEEVHAALARHVPEIATGGVEVIDIARNVGVASKVVIRATHQALSPVGACIGPECKYLDEITGTLGETVWFVEWVEDPQTFIVACLAIPLDKVVSVQIHQHSRSAMIVVQDGETAAKAIGSKGINVQLASKITGLRIKVLLADSTTERRKALPAPGPEDLLKDALTAEVPQIANGTIQILDMVREPNVQSKILVRHSRADTKAISICVGPEKRHVKALTEKLGESVWFVEWVDDQNRLLVKCLGISPDRVLSVDINDVLHKAEVLVTDNTTCAKAIGSQGVNVKQAAQLLGLRFISVILQEREQGSGRRN